MRSRTSSTRMRGRAATRSACSRKAATIACTSASTDGRMAIIFAYECPAGRELLDGRAPAAGRVAAFAGESRPLLALPENQLVRRGKRKLVGIRATPHRRRASPLVCDDDDPCRGDLADPHWPLAAVGQSQPMPRRAARNPIPRSSSASSASSQSSTPSPTGRPRMSYARNPSPSGTIHHTSSRSLSRRCSIQPSGIIRAV